MSISAASSKCDVAHWVSVCPRYDAARSYIVLWSFVNLISMRRGLSATDKLMMFTYFHGFVLLRVYG